METIKALDSTLYFNGREKRLKILLGFCFEWENTGFYISNRPGFGQNKLALESLFLNAERCLLYVRFIKDGDEYEYVIQLMDSWKVQLADFLISFSRSGFKFSEAILDRLYITSEGINQINITISRVNGEGLSGFWNFNPITSTLYHISEQGDWTRREGVRVYVNDDVVSFLTGNKFLHWCLQLQEPFLKLVLMLLKGSKQLLSSCV